MNNDGGPAFPQHDGQNGMSLRDWFAGQALSGYLAGVPACMISPDEKIMSKALYAIADAMIEARKPKEGDK